MQNKYEITAEDYLYRRFPIIEDKSYAYFWKWENGKKIPSSAAFKTKSNEDGLSVDIAALTSPSSTAGNPEQFGVAEFPASVPLSLGYGCRHDPKPENAAHALIVGDTTRIAKKLSRAITKIFVGD